MDRRLTQSNATFDAQDVTILRSALPAPLFGVYFAYYFGYFTAFVAALHADPGPVTD